MDQFRNTVLEDAQEVIKVFHGSLFLPTLMANSLKQG